MKELQEFIELYTNADDFFEECRPHEFETTNIDLDVFDSVLVPNGIGRWRLNPYHRNSKLTKDEVISICLEENLIHPIIAIQTMIMKCWDVLMALHDIQTKVIIEAGRLGM